MQTSARRIRAYLLLTLIGLLFLLALLLCGFQSIQAGTPWPARMSAVAGVVILLGLPAWVGFVAVRRKLTMERWSVGSAEQAASAERLKRRGTNRWGSPPIAVVLLCTGLLNVVSTTMRLHKHPGSGFDIGFLVFWLGFTGLQACALYKALHARTSATAVTG